MGKRHWDGKADEQQTTYENRRRVQGVYGKKPTKTKQRTGGTKLRPLLRNWRIAALSPARTNEHPQAATDPCGSFNLSLILRKNLGAGTPRELKNRAQG
jgi:hypothetical protein